MDVKQDEEPLCKIAYLETKGHMTMRSQIVNAVKNPVQLSIHHPKL
jgi:hypothetical protein